MLITMRIIHFITVFTCLLNVINGFRYHQEKIHKPNNEYYLEQMKYSPVSNENEFMWPIKNKFTTMNKNNFNDAQYDYELQKLDIEQDQMLNDNIEDQETASLSESPKTSYTLPSSQDTSKYDEIDDGIQTTSLSSSSSSSSYPSDQNMIRSAEIVQKPNCCENLKCQLNSMINSNDKNVQNYYANIRKGEVFIHRPAPVIVKRPPTKILVNHPPIIVKPAPVVFHRPPSVLMHPLIIKKEPQPVKVQPVYVKVIKPPERKVIINETNLNGNGMGNDVDANIDADVGLNNHNQHDDNNYLEDSKDFI